MNSEIQLSLPPEVWYHIIEFLPLEDAIACRSVSRAMRDSVDSMLERPRTSQRFSRTLEVHRSRVLVYPWPWNGKIKTLARCFVHVDCEDVGTVRSVLGSVEGPFVFVMDENWERGMVELLENLNTEPCLREVLVRSEYGWVLVRIAVVPSYMSKGAYSGLITYISSSSLFQELSSQQLSSCSRTSGISYISYRYYAPQHLGHLKRLHPAAFLHLRTLDTEHLPSNLRKYLDYGLATPASLRKHLAHTRFLTPQHLLAHRAFVTSLGLPPNTRSLETILRHSLEPLQPHDFYYVLTCWNRT